jgi:choice-of-anchor A domain-containing protein
MSGGATVGAGKVRHARGGRTAVRTAGAALALLGWLGMASVEGHAVARQRPSGSSSEPYRLLGGPNPFPWGLYIGGPATLAPVTANGTTSAGDTTGSAAIAGPFSTQGFTVDGGGCVTGSGCDSLVAPQVAAGSSLVVNQGDIAAGPLTTSGQPSGWTLANNGHGSLAAATLTSPLNFADENAYLQELDTYLSGLKPRGTVVSGGPTTLTITAQSGSSLAVAPLTSRQLSQLSAGTTLDLSVPTGVTLVVQLPSQADLRAITTVGASTEAATHTIFVAAPPASEKKEERRKKKKKRKKRKEDG